LQDALLGAWRDFGRYREGTAFGAWVMKYLVNNIRNRNRLLYEELEVPLPAELEDPETLLDWESAYENFFREPESVLATFDDELARAIRALSEAERLVLLLRCVGEHHEEYISGKSPIQVRGPDIEAVRNFYAGELGFDVLVPDGRIVAEAVGRAVDLVGARRCTFLGGPVAYVTYRIADRDVTAILGPLKPPESLMEAISRSPDGLIEAEVRGCRVLIATVRGVLFVAAGPTESDTLRRLLEKFQARR
jgi:hypothetical protein